MRYSVSGMRRRLELVRLRSEPNADRYVVELCVDQERISLCLWERLESELIRSYRTAGRSGQRPAQIPRSRIPPTNR